MDGMRTRPGALQAVDRPLAIMFPHDGVGRLDADAEARPPSATMATAMPSRAIENIAGSTLGSTSGP